MNNEIKYSCDNCLRNSGTGCKSPSICICGSNYLPAEESDRIRRDNTIRALKELFTLYHNSNYVSQRINDENTRIEGYTRHSFSELKDAIDVIRSRYGYYCNIKYTYDPCYMFLVLDVMMRKEAE